MEDFMPNKQFHEKRSSFRLPFTAQVICYTKEDDKICSGKIHDISADGLSMETDTCPNIGEECNIEIIIEGEESRLIIDKLSGKIIRENDNVIAICFDKKLEWLALVPIYFQKIHNDV